MSFVTPQFISQIPSIDRHAADAQPYGVVQVDDQGVIKMYNKWESEMAGVPISTAEGSNFFTQVAPCTNNRLVFGKFKDGVARNELDTEFNYLHLQDEADQREHSHAAPRALGLQLGFREHARCLSQAIGARRWATSPLQLPLSPLRFKPSNWITYD